MFSIFVFFSRFVYVPPPHIKEILYDVLLDFLLDLTMDRKIFAITVDNFSSNDGKVFHMRCATHILNLVVKI